MRVPVLSDKIVKARAYITDEDFGYSHWRAAQYAAPAEITKFAIILMFDSEEERDARLAELIVH